MAHGMSATWTLPNMTWWQPFCIKNKYKRPQNTSQLLHSLYNHQTNSIITSNSITLFLLRCTLTIFSVYTSFPTLWVTCIMMELREHYHLNLFFHWSFAINILILQDWSNDNQQVMKMTTCKIFNSSSVFTNMFEDEKYSFLSCLLPKTSSLISEIHNLSYTIFVQVLIITNAKSIIT